MLSQLYFEMKAFLKTYHVYVGPGRRVYFLSLSTLFCTQRIMAHIPTSEAENGYQPLNYLISSNSRFPESDFNAVPWRQNHAGLELVPTFLPVLAYFLEALKHSDNCVTYMSH